MVLGQSKGISIWKLTCKIRYIYAETTGSVQKQRWRCEIGVHLILGVYIDWLAVAPNNPNFIYAATYPNILVTTNGGASWNTRQLPVAYEYMNLLEVDPQDPNVIYTFVGGDFLLSLYKSIDGGASWTELFYGGGYYVVTSALKIDSANPNIVYAATYFGVYKSTNGGASWALHGTACIPGVPCDPPTALGLAIARSMPGLSIRQGYNGSFLALTKAQMTE